MHNFLNHLWELKYSKPSSWYSLSFEEPLITSVIARATLYGQVDSPELPEMPEIMEMIENFSKVTKYLTKFIETLTYVWEKSHVKKQ